MQETQIWSLGKENPLEEETATFSSILVWWVAVRGVTKSWTRLSNQIITSQKIKPVNPKGNQPEHSLEELMLKLKLQFFGHLMWRTDSFGP